MSLSVKQTRNSRESAGSNVVNRRPYRSTRNTEAGASPAVRRVARLFVLWVGGE